MHRVNKHTARGLLKLLQPRPPLVFGIEDPSRRSWLHRERVKDMGPDGPGEQGKPHQVQRVMLEDLVVQMLTSPIQGS